MRPRVPALLFATTVIGTLFLVSCAFKPGTLQSTAYVSTGVAFVLVLVLLFIRVRQPRRFGKHGGRPR